nr:histidine kinase [Sphingomonas sp.]
MSREEVSTIASMGEFRPFDLPRAERAKGTSPGKWGRRLQLATLILLISTAVGVFEAVPEMLRVFYWYVFVAKLVDAWAWALLAPAILLIDRKYASREQNVGRLVLVYLILSVPFSLAHTLLCGLLLYPIPEVWWGPLRDPDFAVYFFLGGWATYCAIVGILEAFRYYNRYLTGQLRLERVERSLVESRLNALRLHLEPHFLFNTLNAIASEVGENPELARNMIGDLGALLRRSLDSKDSAEITLAQELALLEHYLSIQRVRFGERLGIKIDVAPDLLSEAVPSMLLQPLVENSIRHGIEGRMSGGTIAVSAFRTGDQLQLQVLDDGPGVPRDWRIETTTGHGLKVTFERLRALYPRSGTECLTVRRGKAGGTEVTIRIPRHTVVQHAINA